MATAGGTLDLDNVVQHHPRGQQGGQRMPAGAVAMTQAKQTLTLAHLPGANPFLDALRDVPAVWRDAPVNLSETPPVVFRRYRRLSLRNVFLSFAGYRDPTHPVHQAIAALKPGDRLQVRVDADRWELLDDNGMVVGQLARGFSARPSAAKAHANVLAIVSWDKERSEPDYRQGLRSDAWEVVVPDLVFAPQP